MEKFLAYLQTLQSDYSSLAALLHKKREAILAYDLTTLSDIMKDEQAYVLLSRGFNANVEAFRRQLALKGNTLGEVIENLPPQWRPKFQQVFAPLKEAIDNVRERNQECQLVIEQRLGQIGKRIENLSGAGSKAYRQTGGAPKPAKPSQGMLNKSI
jgi:hypothetical protein